MTKKQTIPSYLYEHIKKTVNLADFIENDIGCKLNWADTDNAKAICPMPSHQDTKPSFCVYKKDDNVWQYWCWGCNVKGSVIDFFMDYYDLPNAGEAVLAICKRFNIKHNDVLATDTIKNIKSKVNVKKKVECANIVASNQCRCLLRKNYDLNSKWVSDSYKKMNKAMDDDDIEAIEAIGFEASNRMEKK